MGMRTIRAEMAGTIVSVERQVGDAVAAEDTLIVMESMKMEIPIPAPAAGTVVELLVAAGEVVTEDQLLMRLEGAA